MLVFIFVPIIGVVLSEKTIGDVKKCRENAAEACMTQCKAEHADVPESSWNSIRTCTDDKKTALKECFPGSSDLNPCFAWKRAELGKNDTALNISQENQANNQSLNEPHVKIPKEAQKPFSCLLKCQMSNHTNCFEGCKADPPEKHDGDKMKILSCGKSAQRNFDDCLKEKFSNL